MTRLGDRLHEIDEEARHANLKAKFHCGCLVLSIIIAYFTSSDAAVFAANGPILFYEVNDWLRKL